jgi:hypothetical protein
MKIRYLVALSVVLGVPLGVVTAEYWAHWSMTWDGTAAGSDDQKQKPVMISTGESGEPVRRGEITVDNEDYDFGVMDSRSLGRHVFVLKNAGAARATLSKGESSCHCTKFELEKTALEPGESMNVTVEWLVAGFRGRFRQTTAVLTSDAKPERITLTVRGLVISALRAEPNELLYTNLAAGETISKTIDIFTFVNESIKIAGHQFLDAATAKYFEAKFEPMSREQVAKEKDARGGYVAHVTIKSGLPSGSFRQTIRIATDFKDAPDLEIPISGKVTSDLTVTGPDYSDENGVLTIGPVASEEGAQRKLFVLVRGKFRKEVKLKPVESVPALLKVEVGEPRSLMNGSLVQMPLTIRIPKGSPPANHLGSEVGRLGRVTIETSHPVAPTLRIYVRFAVKD